MQTWIQWVYSKVPVSHYLFFDRFMRFTFILNLIIENNIVAGKVDGG